MERLKDINWNHLYGFYEVAQAKSLKAAARNLKLAPSTLSEQLKKLEEKFGKTLFNRSSKGLTLTNDGIQLHDHTKVIFEEGSRVLEKFSEIEVGGYAVRIGIEESFFQELATEFASQYWDLYAPFGTVNTVRQMDAEVLFENISQGNVDWGISMRKPKRKNLGCAPIGAFNVVFLCSSKLYKKFIEAKDLLVNIPFAETSSDVTLNRSILRHLRRNGVDPKERIYSDHPDFVRNLCKRGRCIMAVPENPRGKYPGLKAFSIEEPLSVNLFAIWNKRDSNLVSIKKLHELIKSKFSQAPERYDDIELQIEVSEVSDDLLT